MQEEIRTRGVKETMTDDCKNVYKLALEKWGRQAQLGMAIEEMAELIQAINKFSRGKVSVDSISEEIADVEIMMEQLKEIFANKTYVNLVKIKKINRLKELLQMTKAKEVKQT